MLLAEETRKAAAAQKKAKKKKTNGQPPIESADKTPEPKASPVPLTKEKAYGSKMQLGMLFGSAAARYENNHVLTTAADAHVEDSTTDLAIEAEEAGPINTAQVIGETDPSREVVERQPPASSHSREDETALAMAIRVSLEEDQAPPLRYPPVSSQQPLRYPGLQIRGLKFQSSHSNSRELELTNLLGLVLGCIEAKFCK